ncbi:MAG: vanadium-dependent haloperoxidase [Acidiferrobacterales bacterium]|nr:vanadium-dependent haloperoxidase [Acidiferrobacterales bacterium]
MLQGTRNLSLSPLEASRGYAMAHLAGYLAVGGQPILPGLSWSRSSFSPSGLAYLTAFFDALEEAWSTSFAPDKRRLAQRYHDAPQRTEAIIQGQKAARAVTRWRTRDGAEPARSRIYPDRYPKRDDVLSWKPTAPFYGASSGPDINAFQRGLLPGWGAQDTWAIGSVSRFEAAPFPDHESPEFARQFEKVQLIGGANSPVRTEEQSEVALFWEDGPGGVTAPGHFQLLALELCHKQSWTLLQQARFFCALSIAQADAAIASWHNKFHHDILRPETAIRYANTRFRPSSSMPEDSSWHSYIPTPAFPSYVSGHSVFGAASAGVMRLLLGSDRIRLTAVPADLVNWPMQLKNVSRSWNSLTAIAEENGASREYGGVHWEEDNQNGLQLGFAIADTVVKNSFSS